MPVQHSPPARQTRAQAVPTQTPSVPLDGTPEVLQLRAHLVRGPVMEGEAPTIQEGRGPRMSSSFSGVLGTFLVISRTTLNIPGEDDSEEENFVEEEESDSTEADSTHSEPSSLEIMQKMAQIMENLQAASSSEASISPAFKTPSMKAPDCFDGTQPFKVRRFINSCQLIFHNDKETFSEDRKKLFYSTSFLIGRDAKLIEPYLSNPTNKDPAYLLNNLVLFKYQIFTLFGHQEEVRKA
ncbi:hypothetical protein O181_060493 [Austropuccinia psidii MF-1]|uniref:Uncharacterized protein n=1 Tax=Austropuccinia psidii MF-1 TaxID=1389203 RepID=A0A9Q3HXL3_9BASI|nr:hypothetical protein [Austropuccinia psidii MF-1]